MFQKVRIRLTLLCSGIITLLIIIMSFLYLRISENTGTSFIPSRMTAIPSSPIWSSSLSSPWNGSPKWRHREATSFICWITGIPFFIIRCMALSLRKTLLLLHQMMSPCPEAGHRCPFLTFLKRHGLIMKARCPMIPLCRKKPPCLLIRHGTRPSLSQILTKMTISAHWLLWNGTPHSFRS